MIFTDVTILFAFDTEGSKAHIDSVWDCQVKMCEYILKNRDRVYAFEPVRMPKNQKGEKIIL